MTGERGVNPFLLLGAGSVLVAAAATLAWETVWNVDAASDPTVTGELSVEYVLDGDTLIMADAGGREDRVRIIGIDTPEIGHDGDPDDCYALAARALLEQLVDDAGVTLRTDPSQSDRDRYGRPVRHVDVDGASVAVQLLEAGAGREYTFDAPNLGQDEHRAAERRAAGARAGLWGSCPIN